MVAFVCYLFKWKDKKRPATSNFRHNGYKFWINCTEATVMSISCDFDVIVALLFSCWLAVDVPKLGGPHSTKSHL